MTATEVIERARESGTTGQVGNDVLQDALQRLEIMIQKYVGTEHNIPDKDSKLLAAGGGVASGYDDMYDLYVKREACRIREDWECFGNYDALFTLRFNELKQELTRSGKCNRKGESFSPEWRWS